MILHVAGWFGIIIPLLTLAEKAPSHQVWQTFYDPGWGNQGLSCLIGIVASVAPLLGADASGKAGSSMVNASRLILNQHTWPKS